MWSKLEKEYNVKKGPYARFFKRVIDFCATLAGFIIISPLFLIL
jgi:lipopolysaccharide/colanic/teichoic acid biosynthesis glycosyltransferase